MRATVTLKMACGWGPPLPPRLPRATVAPRRFPYRELPPPLSPLLPTSILSRSSFPPSVPLSCTTGDEKEDEDGSPSGIHRRRLRSSGEEGGDTLGRQDPFRVPSRTPSLFQIMSPPSLSASFLLVSPSGERSTMFSSASTSVLRYCMTPLHAPMTIRLSFPSPRPPLPRPLHTSHTTAPFPPRTSRITTRGSPFLLRWRSGGTPFSGKARRMRRLRTRAGRSVATSRGPISLCAPSSSRIRPSCGEWVAALCHVATSLPRSRQEGKEEHERGVSCWRGEKRKKKGKRGRADHVLEGKKRWIKKKRRKRFESIPLRISASPPEKKSTFTTDGRNGKQGIPKPQGLAPHTWRWWHMWKREGGGEVVTPPPSTSWLPPLCVPPPSFSTTSVIRTPARPHALLCTLDVPPSSPTAAMSPPQEPDPSPSSLSFTTNTKGKVGPTPQKKGGGDTLSSPATRAVSEGVSETEGTCQLGCWDSGGSTPSVWWEPCPFTRGQLEEALPYASFVEVYVALRVLGIGEDGMPSPPPPPPTDTTEGTWMAPTTHPPLSGVQEEVWQTRGREEEEIKKREAMLPQDREEIESWKGKRSLERDEPSHHGLAGGDAADASVLWLPSFSMHAVKASYHTLVKQLHPDLCGGDGTRMERIITAYQKVKHLSGIQQRAYMYWIWCNDGIERWRAQHGGEEMDLEGVDHKVYTATASSSSSFSSSAAYDAPSAPDTFPFRTLFRVGEEGWEVFVGSFFFTLFLCFGGWWWWWRITRLYWDERRIEKNDKRFFFSGWIPVSSFSFFSRFLCVDTSRRAWNAVVTVGMALRAAAMGFIRHVRAVILCFFSLLTSSFYSAPSSPPPPVVKKVLLQ